ncbi:hypothetical protein H4S02_009062, partial [Coemansia sp. RSA 2611]
PGLCVHARVYPDVAAASNQPQVEDRGYAAADCLPVPLLADVYRRPLCARRAHAAYRAHWHLARRRCLCRPVLPVVQVPAAQGGGGKAKERL